MSEGYSWWHEDVPISRDTDRGGPAVRDTWTSSDDVNPICGCHRRSNCLGCGTCTNCDACYCGED